jgi:serine/threonine protein kinase
MLAGRYRLESVLGKGGMGTVHRGRDVVLDRPVAVKVFVHDATDPTQSERYEQEARILARLSHPGLVTVFDAGIDVSDGDGPQPYLVMEYVTGPTLADRIAQAPLAPAQAAMLASQLSTALAYIHRRGIVHRDVKPANILLEPAEEPGGTDTAKLTDFGIARLVDGARLTMSGFTLGTANYLSPEQISGAEVTPASDVYSLGLVLLECLTGQVAYPGHGVEAALSRLHRRPYIPDSVPDGWARLLTAMTDAEPGNRPSATEIGVVATGLGSDPQEAGRIPDAFDSDTAPLGPADRVPAAADPAATRVLPTAEPAGAWPGRIRRRRRFRTWTAVAGVAAAAVVIAIIVAVATSIGGPGAGPPASPTYPSVPGKLGTDLHQLQQDVAP